MFPNCFGPVIVRATLDVSYAVLILSGFDFIGLGAEPPTPEWGALLTRSREYLIDHWWYPTFPASPSSSLAWPSASWATRSATPSTLAVGSTCDETRGMRQGYGAGTQGR